MRAEIDLKQSINTTSIDADVKPITQPGELLKNNGIHNDGGITNLYLNSDAYVSGEHFTADTGEDIQTLVNGSFLDVSAGGQQIGSVSPYGVKHRRIFKGYDDVMVCDANTIPATYQIVTCQLVGNQIVVKGFFEDGTEDPDLARTLTFTQISIIGTTYQSLNFVRWNGCLAGGNLKFILRSGTKAILLDEADLTAGEQDYRASLYGMAEMGASITIPGKYTAFMSSKGRLSSVDIYGKWKNWDGSGDGSGPYLNIPISWLTSSPSLLAGGSFGELLLVEESSGIYRLSSYDGSQWKFYDGTGTGTGIYASSIFGPRVVLFNYTYDGAAHDSLIIGGATGINAISSFDYERNFKKYDGTGIGKALSGSVVSLIGANVPALYNWNNYLIVKGSSTRIASYDQNGVAKNYDGTGTGTGPYSTSGIVFGNIQNIVTGPIGELVLLGTNGQISSYDGTNWKKYDGTLTGLGIYTNGVGIGTDSFNSGVVQIINGESVFIACSNTGRLCSFSPSSGWKSYDGTGAGTGPYANYPNNPQINQRMYTLVKDPTNTKTLFPGGGQVMQINVDGTIKSGTIGININQRITGLDSSARSCIYENAGKKYLVFGYSVLSSYCFDDNTFSFYDGTGGGDGPFASAAGLATILGAGNYISSMVQYKNFLVVLSSVGRVASWDGVAWKNYDGTGTGTGPFSNTLNVSTPTMNGMCVYKTFLVIGGDSGRVQSFDGTNWKRYDGSGSGTGVYTSSALSGYVIYSMAVYKWNTYEAIIFAGGNGKLASFDGINWKYENGTGGGLGPYSGGAQTGSQNISCVKQYGKNLICGGIGGAMASYDGTAWKNYDGTGAGTGPYSNATILGANAIYGLAEYDGTLIVKGEYTMGSISPGSTAGAWSISSYQDTNGYNMPNDSNVGYAIHVVNDQLFVPCAYASVLQGQNAENYSFNFDQENKILSLPYNDRGQLFAYYWPDNDAYLFGVPGNNSNLYILNYAGINYPIRAKYAVPVEYPSGNTEIILTFDPIMYEVKYRIKGKIGNINDGIFKPVEQYPTYTLGRPTTYLQSECGPGYSQGNFYILNDTSVYSAFGPTDADSEYIEVKTNTDAFIGSRGQIGNFYSIPINGFFGALSYATASDQLGVTLTALGEIDATYTPQAIGFQMIYLSSEGFVYVALGTDINMRVEKISSNLYKINTVSPYNILNITDKKLYLGSLDYNGRLLVSDNTTITAITKRIVGQVSGKYSNGYDTGEDLAGVTLLTPDKITAPGSKITGGGYIQEQFGINVFIDDDYSHTIDETGAAEIVATLDGTLYIEDTREPIPMIADYKDGVAVIAGKTFYLAGDDYDGAESGAGLSGEYGYFNLFGQDYIFDNRNIYLLNLDDNGLISSYPKAAPIVGLTYIAVSPTAAFFYSDFDGGLYVFDGGRSVQKQDKLNRESDVIGGAYSNYEAALYLETATRFIVYRDGVKTAVDKMPEMVGLRLYDTADGFMFGNNLYRWQYSYRSGDALLPLSVKTGFLGIPCELVKVSAIVAQVYSATREQTEIDLTVSSYSETKAQEVKKKVTIGANGWDLNGIAHVRIQPNNQRGVGVSVEIECAEKIVICGLWYEYEGAEKITTQRSV